MQKPFSEVFYEKLLILFPSESHGELIQLFETWKGQPPDSEILNLRNKYFSKNHPNWHKIARLINLNSKKV